MSLTVNAPKFEPFRRSTLMHLQRTTWRGKSKIQEITAVADEWEQLQVCVEVLAKMLDEQVRVNCKLRQALESLPAAVDVVPPRAVPEQSIWWHQP